MPNYTAYVQSYPDLVAAYNDWGNKGGKSIEDFGKQHYTQWGASEKRYLPGTQQSYTPGVSLGTGYDIAAGTYSEQEFDVLSAGILTRLNGDIQKEIEAIRGKSAANVATIQGRFGVDIAGVEAGAVKYSADRQKEAQMYIADKDYLKGVEVAKIQGQSALDLQDIVNAGMKEVEGIRGQTARDVANIQGEFNLKQEGERQRGQKDIAKLGAESSLRNALVGAFSF